MPLPTGRIARRSILLAALAGLAAFPAIGTAQVTVRGVVRDRVLRGGPLSGAEVFALNTSKSAVTDDSGRFVLDLPAGRYTIVAGHPVLDTLALGEIELDIEFGTDGVPELELATPERREFQMDRCGRVLGEGEGILLGDVSTSTGEAAPGAALHAHWGVRRLTFRSSTLGANAARAVADSLGSFVICGVPRGEAADLEGLGTAAVRGRVTLDVTAGALRAGPLLLETIVGAVTRRDLVVGDGEATATVRGRLLTDEGEPVTNGRLVSRGDSTLTARTDSLGFFRMRVARRTDQLMVRAIGRMPLQVEVAVVDDEQDLGDLPMSEAAQQLDAVTVRAVMSEERKEFEERRKTGLGTFLDDEELKRMPAITPRQVQNRVPQSEIIQMSPGDRQFVLVRGLGYCKPRFFIDGQDVGVMSGPEQEFFLSQAVRIEVYRATAAPPKYNDFDGCGVVVIATR